MKGEQRVEPATAKLQERPRGKAGGHGNGTIRGAQPKRKARAAKGSSIGSVESRIHERYEDLSPSERRLADIILNFPGELASYSATELAQLADVSKQAATRLFRRLGYDSYKQAKRQAREAQRWGSPLYLEAPTAKATDASAALRAHLECDVSNLARTIETLCIEDVETAVSAIVNARRVLIVGFRMSHVLADYIRRELVHIRDDVQLLPVSGETLAEYLAGLRSDDLVIAVGLRRRIPALRSTMEFAREAGASILYITDTTASRTAKLATWTIRCQVRGGSFFDSYAPAMSVLNYLCSAAASCMGQNSRIHLRRIEDLHGRLREFG